MLIDLLRTRRSIRRYQDRVVESEKLDLLIEAALRAPSSRGRRPWELVIVTEPDLIARLADAKQEGSALLAGAPLVIAVCADATTSDVWIEDASIVMTLLHLEAHDLGLGSCWVQVRRRAHDVGQSASDYVAELLQLDAGLQVEAMLGIGYPAETKQGHARQALPVQKVSFRGPA